MRSARTFPSPARLLGRAAAALVVAALAAPAAQAAVSGVSLVVPEHTRATPDPRGGVVAGVRWAAPAFTPVAGSRDRVELQFSDLTAGASGAEQGDGTFTETRVFAADGSQLVLTLWACQIPSGVTAFCHERRDAERDVAVTRLDGTPPTAAMAIEGGAAFTRTREITLEVGASDPLVGGLPGTSSGITEYALDADGDGTYPCSPLVPPIDLSGCARPFAPRIPVTLPEGDGPKTVGVVVGDGARDVRVPCTGPRCLRLRGAPIAGNRSAPVTGSIVLDTVVPAAVPTLSTTSVRAGASVTFDAALSADPNPGVGSGIDPAATSWDFGDGGSAPGPTARHVYGRGGTFTGSLTVRDRAGNVSAPAPFTVSVAAAGGAATAGRRPVFRLARFTRSVGVRRGRLVGTVALRGTSAAGVVRVTLRKLPSGRAVTLARRVRVGSFSVVLRLPAGLSPGRYRIRVIAPGGRVVRDARVALGPAVRR